MGLIPAHAGNTAAHAESRQCPGDHPRSRGEHNLLGEPLLQPIGSSPLVRGTHEGLEGGRHGPGLIPARTGNTPLPPWRTTPKRAHPRSRGEHWNEALEAMHKVGSSPLARGTSRDSPAGFRKVRLIPARAGNTSKTLSRRLAPPLLHSTHRDRGTNVRRPMPYALPLPIPESRDLRNSSTSVMRRTPSN